MLQSPEADLHLAAHEEVQSRVIHVQPRALRVLTVANRAPADEPVLLKGGWQLEREHAVDAMRVNAWDRAVLEDFLDDTGLHELLRRDLLAQQWQLLT